MAYPNLWPILKKKKLKQNQIKLGCDPVEAKSSIDVQWNLFSMRFVKIRILFPSYHYKYVSNYLVSFLSILGSYLRYFRIRILFPPNFEQFRILMIKNRILISPEFVNLRIRKSQKRK